MVIQEICKNKIDTHVCVLGDFNAISCTRLDTSNTKRKNQGIGKTLIEWLKNKDWIDTYRYLNPHHKDYTWQRDEVSSRIDYIWIGEEMSDFLNEATIEDINLITGSDHKIVTASLEVNKILRYGKLNRRDKNKPTRKIFLYHKATSEDWEAYSTRVEHLIFMKGRTRVIENTHDLPIDINVEWDRISSAIMKAALEHIPWVNVKKTVTQERASTPRSSVYSESKFLYHIIKKSKKSLQEKINPVEKEGLNRRINEINQLHQTQIAQMPEWWNLVQVEDLRNWGKILRKKANAEEQKRKEKEIREKIEVRFGMIEKNKKRMLQSLLNRPHNKITIDRILVEERNRLHNHELISDEEGVKRQVIAHFEEQFRNRNQKFKEMKTEWREVYKPIKDIDPIVYKDIGNPFTLENWLQALSKTKNDSAPGISNIGYILFKKISVVVTKKLVVLMNAIIKQGKIPDKWKLGQIFLIPKNSSWEYNLSNTRPIVLLETCRKILTRMLQVRLDKVISENKILKGANFAGLSGESTSTPIHIMNNLIEEALERKKELWVTFQDMKKAFDSVSMVSLKKALERIKIPTIINDIIMELYEDRQLSVITEYGNTEFIKAGDGIDQGEVLSPLIWRIFYDPLLCRIQEANLGYTMQNPELDKI